MLILSNPLHSLRKTKLFQRLLTTRLNKPKLYDLGYEHSVALRPLTHASIIWRNENLESNIRRLTKSVVQHLDRSGDHGSFIDVGANIGMYSWEVLKNSPKRKILAFEPDPLNFELLERTLREYDFENIEIYPFALSNKNQKVSFYQDTITSATGNICGSDKTWIENYLGTNASKISIETKRLDSFKGEKLVPSLIKVDVEGHELEVLEGAEAIIAQVKPIMIIESFPPKQMNVLNFLYQFGYKVNDADQSSAINKNTLNLFAWHPRGPLDAKFVHRLVDT